MKINSIHIQNFRKLQLCTIDFSEKETIFVGANNSGKTTAMVALMIFLKTKSFKTQDFTLCHWKSLNEVGENWIKADELKEEDNIESTKKLVKDTAVGSFGGQENVDYVKRGAGYFKKTLKGEPID